MVDPDPRQRNPGDRVLRVIAIFLVVLGTASLALSFLGYLSPGSNWLAASRTFRGVALPVFVLAFAALLIGRQMRRNRS